MKKLIGVLVTMLALAPTTLLLTFTASATPTTHEPAPSGPHGGGDHGPIGQGLGPIHIPQGPIQAPHPQGPIQAPQWPRPDLDDDNGSWAWFIAKPEKLA
jgi:hypothetical protein